MEEIAQKEVAFSNMHVEWTDVKASVARSGYLLSAKAGKSARSCAILRFRSSLGAGALDRGQILPSDSLHGSKGYT